MKTYMPKRTHNADKWWIVDATGVPVGRLATRVASVLRGKHSPLFTPHLDLGDHVVVVNAERVGMTGDKREQREKTRYSGWPGGGKSQTWDDMMKKRPERVIELAVWGMLPHNRLGRRLIRKLKVYAGSAHRHEAQRPAPLEIPNRRSV